LIYEVQRETGFHFNDDGWIFAAHRHHIAAVDFGFDAVALGFEEGFDGEIEIGFGHSEWSLVRFDG
jgi:hypothetical protein